MSIEQYFKDLQGKEFDDERWGTAPCTEINDPDIYFDIEHNMSNERLHELKIAITLCDGCPLKTECLNKGMQGEDLLWGIWGGLFPSERMALAGMGGQRRTRTSLQATQNLRNRMANLTMEDK